MDEGLVSYLSGAIKGGKAKGQTGSGTANSVTSHDNGKGVFQVAVPLQQATYEFFLAGSR